MKTSTLRNVLFLLSIAIFTQVSAQTTGAVLKPPGCGSSIGCLSDCQGTTCGFVITWTASGTDAIYTFSTALVDTSGTWIAIGFSSDTSMGGDDVLGCASNASNMVASFTAANNRFSPPTYYTDVEVRLTSGKVDNNILSCTIQRPIVAAANGRRDVGQQWTLLTARGVATNAQPGQVSIRQHTNNNRYWSSIPLGIRDYRDAGAVNGQTVITSTTLITSTPATTTGIVSKPPGCGSSIGCLSDCQGATCGFVITWTASGDDAIYTFSTSLVSTSGTWIAIGFSSDSSMGDDDVLGCASDVNNRVVSFTATNNPYSPPSYYNDTDVRVTSGKVDNNIMSCTIQRPIPAAANGRKDVGQQWTLLTARGVATFTQAGQPRVERHSSNNRYWSSVPLGITDNRDERAVNSQTASPAPTTGTVAKPPGCGTSIGCISDCQDSTCGFTVTWSAAGADATYTFSTTLVSTSGTYIAIGFSADSKMGADDVMGCASNVSGPVVLFTALNNVHEPPTYYTDATIVLVSGQVTNNVLSCTIRRPIANSRTNVSQPWTLLVAKGEAIMSPGAVQIRNHNNNRFISERQVTVSDRLDLGASSGKSQLVKAHGSLMIVAWIFLASIGIVLARYYKPVWSGLMCSEKIWFQLHRICMILVFCATVAGFIIIFVEIDGYSKINEERTFLVGHPIIGIIVMILTVVNPVMALFRPHPGTPRRPIFNWAHFGVGTVAHILAVVNIFFGVLLTMSNVPYYLVYILGAYVAWQIFVELLLEILSFFGRKLDRSDAYEMNTDDGAKNSAAVESSTTILIKRIILVVHCVIVAVLSAALIGLLATGKEELEK